MKPTYIKSPTRLSSLVIAYHAGPVYETLKKAGLSHFMEHLICEGYKSMEDEMQALGVEVNAFTTNDAVAFYISGLDTSIAQVADRWVRAITTYVPTPKDVLQESGVIFQEIKDRHANRNRCASCIALSEVLGIHSPVGTKETLEGLSAKDIMHARLNMFGRPCAIVHCAPSPLDLEVPEFGVPIPDREVNHRKLHEAVLSDDPSAYLVLWNAKLDNWSNRDLSNLRIAADMLASGLHSPLLKLLRNDNSLVYSAGAGVGTFHETLAVLQISASGSKKNLKRIVSLTDGLLLDLDSWFTWDRYETVKAQAAIQEEVSRQTPSDVTSYIMETIFPIDKLDLDVVSFDGARDALVRALKKVKYHDSGTLREISKERARRVEKPKKVVKAGNLSTFPTRGKLRIAAKKASKPSTKR